MTRSKIEWTDETWNPVRGCTKVSPGCKNCYAETFAERFRGVKGHPYEQGFDLRLVPQKLTEPLSWKKPRRVFVNSMSDLFQDGVPFPFVAAVFAVMAYCRRHTFQVLTKRPDRMREFMTWVNAPEGADTFTELYGEKAGQSITLLRMNRVDQDLALQFHDDTEDGVSLDACLHNEGAWPLPNVWLGVSVENQHFADQRIPLLLQTPAAVRFISAEPLLGPVDLRRVEYHDDHAIDALYGEAWTMSDHVWLGHPFEGGTLDWVIVGGESGHGARPFDVGWARAIVAQCRAAGVACFVKQLGEYVTWNGIQGGYGDGPSNIWPHGNGELPDAGTGRFRKYLRDKKGGDPTEWPEDLRVREFPGAGQ